MRIVCQLRDVIRKFPRGLVGSSLVVVVIGAVSGCEPLPTDAPIVEDTARVAPAVGMVFDRALLASFDTASLSLGARTSLKAVGEPISPVNGDEVTVRDSAIADLDSDGILLARAPGQTWLVWPQYAPVDSVPLTVADPVFVPIGLQGSYNAPEAPRIAVDVRYPSSRGRSPATVKTWRVPAGGDLQQALNLALPGDEIVLENGATFTGNYVLPAKSAATAGWIVIKSETVPVAAGTRMTPSAAPTLARIVTPNEEAAIKTAARARRWRIVGVEIAHKDGAQYNFGIVVLGRGTETLLENQPSDIVLDRVFVHGNPLTGASRCIAFNGRSLAVIDSWISECHAKGADSQGVCGWSGAGPFLIENNFIEASGQGVMFGGADPAVANVSPSDIVIRRNHIYKPLTWARGKWSIKAAFELKHGRRVRFENNIIENHWVDAQVGYAILLQTLADNNTSWAWTTVQDVLIRNNLIKNSTSGINILARVAYNGGRMPLNPTSRIAVVNNLFLEVGHDPVTGEEGREVQLLSDLVDVSVVNNLFTLSSGRAQHALSLDGLSQTRTTVVNNVFPASTYGVYGNSKGSGIVALNFYAPGSAFYGNTIPNQNPLLYPPNNYFPMLGVTGIPLTAPLSDACSGLATLGQLLQLPTGIGLDCPSIVDGLRNVAGVPTQ